MNRYTRLSLAAALALGFAAVAQANPMMGQGGPMAGRMCQDMDARMAAHTAFMETKLNLTEAQKPDFKALTEAMKKANEPMKAACAKLDAGGAAPTNPAAHMESMRSMMQARLASMDTIIPAMKSFYDSLSPEQKKAADGLMGQGGMGMGGGGPSARHWH